MTNNKPKTAFRIGGLFSILLLSSAMLVAQQPLPPPDSPYAQPQAAPQLLSPQQLDSLVAPVALYPDALLSQVLVAATYPAEIAGAAQWLNQNPGLQGQQLLDVARQQNWDPSIQALVVFPDVISRLASDMQWTTDLGNAFLAQQADVMAAIQRLRAQAEAAGQLQSNAQQVVTTEYEGGQPAIEIAPVNPDLVYVPYYNPVYIWGPAAWGYYPDWCGFGFGFGFGPGIYINAFFGGIGWGGWGWGCNWFHGFVFNRPYFFNHCGFNGFVAGQPWGGYNVWAHNAYHRLGVSYPTNTLSARYGAISNSRRAFNSIRLGTQPVARSFQHFNGVPNRGQSRFNTAPSIAGRSNANIGARNAYRPGSSFAPTTGARPSTGWSHFSGTPATGYRSNVNVGAASPYRPSQSVSRSYTTPTYQPSPSVNRSYTTPTYRPSPSLSRSYSTPTYRPSPPVSRSYSAPTYRPSPSVSRSYTMPTYRPSPSVSRSYSTPTYRHSPPVSHSYSAPIYRPSPPVSRSYSAPTYRPSPSFNRSYSEPAYRPSPSVSRSYNAPSYHSAPSFSRGTYSAPRSSSGGGSNFHSNNGGSHDNGHR